MDALREVLTARQGRADDTASVGLQAENTRLKQRVAYLEDALTKATAAATAAKTAKASEPPPDAVGADVAVLRTQLGLLKDRAATLEERSAADRLALQAVQKEREVEVQRLRAELAEHQARQAKANETLNMLKERAATLERRSAVDAAALLDLQRENADNARARAEQEAQKNAARPTLLSKILRR